MKRCLGINYVSRYYRLIDQNAVGQKDRTLKKDASVL